jgi:hypothetical protein
VDGGRVTLIHAYRTESEAIEALKAAPAPEPAQPEAVSPRARG